MTTKTLSGSYVNGYTLAAGYTALTVTSSASIIGVNGSSYNYVNYPGGAGGDGLTVNAAVSISNSGMIRGGAGGNAGDYANGGAGGVGAILVSGGTLVNIGSVAGGSAGNSGYEVRGYPGVTGATGGAGVSLAAAGSVSNMGSIRGGAGGGGAPAFYGYGGSGGAGGAGISLAAGGIVSNAGVIQGGAGGVGGYCYYHGGGGGAGGDGVLALGAVSVVNAGGILGGSGGSGSSTGASGRAVALLGGGSVMNGTPGASDALISGSVGIYVGSGAQATVTNYGKIDGTGGVAVRFASSQDRLVVESKSAFIGSVQGGGGALELAGGSATVAGLGSVGILSGAAAMTFSGFGSYVVDAGVTLALTGVDALSATQTLTNNGAVNIFGSLTNAGQVLGGVTLNKGSLANLGSIGNGVGMNGGSVTNGSASDTSALITSGGYTVYGNTSGPATVTNFGSITQTGGAANGTAVWLNGGGAMVNGSASDSQALISGSYGVFIGGVGTVTNFGVIDGLTAPAVSFENGADRLIAEAGSSLIGGAAGSGGTLELAGGAGTIRGLGASGVVSGSIAMAFGGFGAYQLDTGTSWTLTGANDIGAGQALTLAAGGALIDKGTLTSAGALTVSGAVSGPGTLTVSGGTATIGAGATVTVAHLNLTGGTTTLDENLTYKGGFSEAAAATVTLGAKDKLTLSGAATLGGVINGAGTVVLASATVSGLTIGGTDALSLTGTATQTGALTIGDATTAKASLSIAAGATWTISGAVGISHGAAKTSSLKVAGTLVKSGAPGTSAINLITTDTGVIEVATGTLDLTNKVSGTGGLKIDAGATLEVDNTAASTLTATFTGAGATLALKAPTTFAATIAGLQAGDSVDLLKIAATGASVNGSDQLVIVNGATTVATLKLTGAYSGATFKIASDTHGGTNITLLTAARVPSQSAFVSAMAGLGSGPGLTGALHAPEAPSRPEMLAIRTTGA